ncbi:hypothetical protein VB796_08795 [Arcicella sp. LKC2W]|uniref:hypothetical protein n=1 Tax=Arcicella sp. LKC2W TaxID=2984198 RepID=UPI002B21DE39|nr:hypothetical protein [Arcicella sp. LKC2W]MEA5459132.1 hypothetical protein [Arcicella sp. LKC2W]
MNISKSTANDITKSILRLNQKEIDDLKKEFADKLRTEYLKTVPSKIKDVFKTNDNVFLKSTNTIKLCGNGWNYVEIHVDRIPTDEIYIVNFTPDEDISNKLMQEYNLIQDAEKAYNGLFIQVESLLINLRTYKRITENFPEAIPYLPKINKTEVAINIPDILSQIKKDDGQQIEALGEVLNELESQMFEEGSEEKEVSNGN